MVVKEIMTKDISYVTPTSNITKAADIMKSLDVGVVPVCDDNQYPVGLITDRDIVIRGVAEKNYTSLHVGNIMTTSVISVTPTTDVHDAAKIMATNQIRRLPVVENGKLVGMVSLGDLANVNIHVNEAGDALSWISKNSDRMF